MDNIRKVFEEANRITQETHDKRMDEIYEYLKENKAKESCNTSHAENGQENYCSSEVE